MQMLIGRAQLILHVDKVMCGTASCGYAGPSPWTVQEGLRAG